MLQFIAVLSLPKDGLFLLSGSKLRAFSLLDARCRPRIFFVMNFFFVFMAFLASGVFLGLLYSAGTFFVLLFDVECISQRNMDRCLLSAGMCLAVGLFGLFAELLAVVV